MLKKIALRVAVALGYSLLGGLAFYLAFDSFMDWDLVRRRVADELGRATGYEVKLSSVSLSGFSGLELGGLVLEEKNPKDPENPTRIKASSLKLDMGVLGLLRGRREVSFDAQALGGRIAGGMDYERITNFMLIDTLITGNWAALQSHLRHLILPALAIGLTSAGFIARLTRGAMLEVMSKDYVRAARAKGLHERAVVFKHGFRNALLPILTFLGLQFGALLGGAVITEMVFSWPGLGRLLLDGILRRDYPVVQATVIIVAFIYVIVNLAVDLAYHLVDPRLRNT